MVTKYHQFSPEERLEFMGELNSSYEEEMKLRRRS
jgi:hypothetical protein